MIYQVKTFGKMTEPPNGLLDPKVRQKTLYELSQGNNSVSDLHDYLDKCGDVISKFDIVELYEDGSADWEVTTTRPLTNSEEKYMIHYILGQCGDGWGEGFEQHPMFEIKGIEYYYSPWNGDFKVKPVIIGKK